jgi:hypothetical protein
MPAPEVDLTSLFNTVTKTLKGNQTSLNEADAYNHDHGDNMVKNFKVITKALKEKQGASPSEQLTHASEILRQSSTSGSAQLYSQGLTQAANQLQGQRAITAQNAMSLVQALIGGQQAAQPAETQPSDLLGGLMGSLMGGGASETPAAQTAETQPSDLLGGLIGSLLGGSASETPASQPAETQPSDLLGGLMGSLLGGGASGAPSQAQPGSQGGGGINLSTLLTAGAAYLQASQQGATPPQALINAVMAGSQMNASPHHTQSGQLVASTLISTLGKLLGGKRQ